jgi:hypothetical protein
MPRKTSSKKVKRKPQKRKYYSPVDSMERTMEATTKMVGTVAIAGMGIGLAGAIIGGMGR